MPTLTVSAKRSQMSSSSSSSSSLPRCRVAIAAEVGGSSPIVGRYKRNARTHATSIQLARPPSSPHAGRGRRAPSVCLVSLSVCLPTHPPPAYVDGCPDRLPVSLPRPAPSLTLPPSVPSDPLPPRPTTLSGQCLPGGTVTTVVDLFVHDRTSSPYPKPQLPAGGRTTPIQRSVLHSSTPKGSYPGHTLVPSSGRRISKKHFDTVARTGRPRRVLSHRETERAGDPSGQPSRLE